MAPRRVLAAVALLLGWAGVAAAQPPAEDPLRAEFRAALDAAGVTRRAPDSAALRNYLLFPYVEVARLRYALGRIPGGTRDQAIERDIHDFLARHADEPVTRDLRREWLLYLGDRAAWGKFQLEAPPVLTDTTLRCHALAARLAQQALDGLREDALALWTTHKERPAACEPVFQWLDTPERLSDAEIESRALFAARSRLKLPASLSHLPPERRALVQLWDRLMASPERELKPFAAGQALPAPRPPDLEVGGALIAAFERIARKDSQAARAIYAGLERSPLLNPDQRASLRQSYALGLAYDFDAESVKVFRELPEPSLDAIGREWRVRAALLQEDWKQALAWIDAMPPVQRQEPRWRYFRARLLERRRPDEARAIYLEIAKEREYYGFLAAERMGRKPQLRPQALADDRALQDELAALPAVQRAHELFDNDLREQAMAELRYALRDRAAGARAQAARLADRWGWHVPAVQMLSELQLWDDLWLRFPRPFDPEVDAAATDTGLPPDWVYAVLRTESLYDSRAVSRAGALGLLQLLLPTARQVAQRSGLPQPAKADLFRPEVNIAIGARYLRELLGNFKDCWVLTLAAYNAGPQRVPAWFPRRTVDAEIWIENIPYNETRGYVQRALSNLVILGWRRNGEPTPILPLLAPLPAMVSGPAS